MYAIQYTCYVATAVQMYQMLLYKWLSLVNVLASVCTCMQYNIHAMQKTCCTNVSAALVPSLGTDRFAYKYRLLCQSLRGQCSVGWTHGESLTVSYQECITNALAVTFKFSSIHASIGHWAAYTLSSLHVWFAG